MLIKLPQLCTPILGTILIVFQIHQKDNQQSGVEEEQ